MFYERAISLRYCPVKSQVEICRRRVLEVDYGIGADKVGQRQPVHEIR